MQIKPISKKTLARIERGLRNWENPNGKARKRFESAIKKKNKSLEQIKEAIARSTRLTAEDLGIIVY